MLKIGKIELPDVYPSVADISGSWDVSILSSTSSINAIKGAFSDKSLSLDFIYVLDKTKYQTVDDFIADLEEEIINSPIVDIGSNLNLFDGAKQGRCVVESYEFSRVAGSPNLVNVSLNLHYKPVYTASILNPFTPIPPSSASSFMDIDWNVLIEMFGSSIIDILWEVPMPETSAILKAIITTDGEIEYLPSLKYNIGWYDDWCEIGDVDTALFEPQMPPLEPEFQIYNSVSNMTSTGNPNEYIIPFKEGMTPEEEINLIDYSYDANSRTLTIFNRLNKVVLTIGDNGITADISQYLGGGLWGKPITMIPIYGTSVPSTNPITINGPVYIGDGIKYGIEVTISFTDNSGYEDEIKISTRFAAPIEFTIKYGSNSGVNKFYKVSGLNATYDTDRKYYAPPNKDSSLPLEVADVYGTNSAVGLSYQSQYTDANGTTRYQTVFYSGKKIQNRGLSGTGSTMVFCTDNIPIKTPVYCSILISPKSGLSDADKIDAFGMLAHSFTPTIVRNP